MTADQWKGREEQQLLKCVTGVDSKEALSHESFSGRSELVYIKRPVGI
jgi:hypothetical protein